MDPVAVGEGVGEPAQGHDAQSVAGHEAGGVPGEAAYVPVGRPDAARAAQIALAAPRRPGHAPGQRHVAVSGGQRPAGDVDGDQRGGTGRLHGEGGPGQAELVGGPGRQEVLVVRGHQQVGGGAEEDRAVRGAVGAHGLAREDADGPGEPFGVVAGVVERVPGGFQEHPLLGVHDGALAGGVAEERRVEPVGVPQDARGGHQRGVGQARRVGARLGELFHRQFLDTAPPF